MRWLVHVWGCAILCLGLAETAWAASYALSGFYPLQQSTVRDVYQDEQGSIWLATDLGLWRWVNDHFETAGERFASVIPTGGMLEHEGRLWIGTADGLVGIDLVSHTYLHGPPQLNGVHVYDLLKDASGGLWCATRNGLYVLEMGGESSEAWRSTQKAAQPHYCLAADAKGRVWAGRDGAVHCYKGRLPSPSEAVKFDDGRVQALLAATNGTLWIGLREKGGLYSLSGGRLSRLGPQQGLTNEEINALAEYPGGEVWVGTQKGAFRWREERFIGIHRAAGLACEQVCGLYVDREELVWLGTQGGGVYLLRSPYVLTYDVYDGLPHSAIQTIQRCGGDDFLVGTAGGFCRMSLEGRVRKFDYTDSVTALFEDQQGRYWAGGPEGLACFDAATGAPLPIPVQEPLSQVTAIGAHPDGRLLVCAADELWAIKDHHAARLSLAGATAREPKVHGLARDAQAGLYVVANSGLYAWGGQRCIANLMVFRQTLMAQLVSAWGGDRRWDALLQGREMRCMEWAPDGELWAGTPQGLMSAENGLFRDVVGRGAPYMEVSDIAVDRPDVSGVATGHPNVLWLATPNGLTRLKSGHFTTFSRGDGFPSNDVRCVETIRPGLLLVGTAQGLSFVESSRLEPSKEAPRVTITDFTAGPEHYDLGASLLEVPNTHRNVRITFQGIGFREEGKGVRYKSRLEGFDEEWSVASSEPKRDYTNLPWGGYRFVVKAVNSLGMESKTAASIAFSIAPPVWLEHWFIATAMIMLSGSGATIWVVQRKRRQLVKAAEAANIAKSQFLANVSHEIRTPITVILACTETMADGKGTGRPVRECVDTIRRNSNHLLGMINDLLDLSKEEAGQLEVDLVPSSVHEILSDVDALMRNSAQRRGLDLRIVYESETPDEILTDPTRLRQTLINLVGNAIKFTTQGHVWLRVRVERAAETRWLIFDVEDTGIGIPPEKIKSIFEAFSQAETSTSRKYGGTGLGLAIARSLAERLHGRLTARSKVGGGSTFTLAIDLAATEVERTGKETRWVPADDHSRFTVMPAKSDRRREEAPAVPALQGHVLLAEDAADIRGIMRVWLESAGVTVTAATEGADAVELAYDGRFDAILMDIHMPGMDGVAAVREIRERGVRTPIVVISADSSEERQAECLEAGVQGFLPKPFQRKRFFEEIARHLRAVPRKDTAGDGPIYSELDARSPRMAAALADFACALDERVTQMESAAARGDTRTVAHLAHQLRGAGGTNGYMCVTDEARCIEESIAKGVWTGVEDHIQELGRLKRRIRAGLEQQGAVVRSS